MHFIGAQSVGIIFLTSGFAGMVLVLQGHRSPQLWEKVRTFLSSIAIMANGEMHESVTRNRFSRSWPCPAWSVAEPLALDPFRFMPMRSGTWNGLPPQGIEELMQQHQQS